MKDLFNEELKLGDIVIIVFSDRSSYSISKARIISFTPKMVRVKAIPNGREALRMPHDVVLFNERTKEQWKQRF